MNHYTYSVRMNRTKFISPDGFSFRSTQLCINSWKFGQRYATGCKLRHSHSVTRMRASRRYVFKKFGHLKLQNYFTTNVIVLFNFSIYRALLIARFTTFHVFCKSILYCDSCFLSHKNRIDLFYNLACGRNINKWINKICSLQLPKEPHWSTRLLQLTGR